MERPQYSLPSNPRGVLSNWRGLSEYFILAARQPAPLPNESLIGCVNPQHF